MKAVIQKTYGTANDLVIGEMEKPVPGDDEVLVQVRAASVHPDVWHMVFGRPYVLRLMGAGFSKPKNPIPGTDMAGVVDAVGKNVVDYKPGDAVFGETIGAMQWVNGGAFAEFVAVPQENLASKPNNISFEQAASIPTSGYIAYLNLTSAGPLKPEQKILVNGAGGGVGALALQLAKGYGANVTAVDSTNKQEMLHRLGADAVIDFTKDDFTKGAETFDLIFDVPGNHSFATCRQVLKPEGKYVLIGHDHFGATGHKALGLLPHFFKQMFLSLFIKQLPKPSFAMPSKKKTMAIFKEFTETQKITPIIDSTYPIDEVHEAFRHMAEDELHGKVILIP